MAPQVKKIIENKSLLDMFKKIKRDGNYRRKIKNRVGEMMEGDFTVKQCVQKSECEKSNISNVKTQPLIEAHTSDVFKYDNENDVEIIDWLPECNSSDDEDGM